MAVIDRIDKNPVEEIEKISPGQLHETVKQIDTQGSAFQVILEGATEALQSISNVEFKTNNIIEKYIEGKATVEEVMVATAQLNLAMSMATSVISTSVQTFKEIQGIPL